MFGYFVFGYFVFGYFARRMFSNKRSQSSHVKRSWGSLLKGGERQSANWSCPYPHSRHAQLVTVARQLGQVAGNSALCGRILIGGLSGSIKTMRRPDASSKAWATPNLSLYFADLRPKTRIVCPIHNRTLPLKRAHVGLVLGTFGGSVRL